MGNLSPTLSIRIMTSWYRVAVKLASQIAEVIEQWALLKEGRSNEFVFKMLNPILAFCVGGA